MKNKLNVFKYGIYSWKYPRNWFSNIGMFFRNLKRAKDRATKGFCDWDIWDLDVWLLELLPASLKEFKDKTQGYPDELGSYEEWIKTLEKIIAHFDEANKIITDDGETLNPYAKEYDDLIANNGVITKSEETHMTTYTLSLNQEQEELKNKFVTEQVKLSKSADKHIEEGLKLIAKYVRHLWY